MNQSTPPFRVLGVVSGVPYKYFGTASAVPYVSNAVSDYRNPLPRAHTPSVVSHLSNVTMRVPRIQSLGSVAAAGAGLNIPRSKIVFPQRGGAIRVPASKINRFGGLLVGARRQITRVRV